MQLPILARDVSAVKDIVQLGYAWRVEPGGAAKPPVRRKEMKWDLNGAEIVVEPPGDLVMPTRTQLCNGSIILPEQTKVGGGNCDNCLFYFPI